MFGGSKRTVENEQMETLIGKNTNFKGTISSKGTIRVDGQFEGEMTTTGDVIIGPTGVVNANMTARNANIAGSLNGNIKLSEKLEIMSSAKVFGDIAVKLLTVEEGAVFKGASQMLHEVPSEKKANK